MTWDLRRLSTLRGAGAVRRFGAQLFDQQMWCWGRDVVRPEGNLLCLFGFVRYQREADAAPESVAIRGVDATEERVSGSGYALLREDGPWLGLWGWGMIYGTAAEGGLFLRRFQFEPVWLDVPHLPERLRSPHEVSAFQGKGKRATERLERLFPATLRWIAAYENWVQEVAGPAYRAACVDQWFKKRFSAVDMSAAWKTLAERIARG